MPYCTYTNVRSICNLTTSDISDADLTTIITYATTKMNEDICTKVVREKVYYIDRTRENDIDGSNTIYYVQNWKGKYIADLDDDGDVDTSDVIVYQVSSIGIETTLTVSAIGHDYGKITLSSAPSSGVELYMTYRWCYKDCSTPSNLIKSACMNLSAALAFEKINAGRAPRLVFGNARFERHMSAYNVFYKKYLDDVNRINMNMADSQESEEVV